MKHTTNVPCPSCGSTRAIISLLKGNYLESLFCNPIGIMLAIIMIICPIWIFYDTLFQKDTLFNFYRKSEGIIRQKKIAISAIFLILLNWIWNIYKGL
ncbi:MAG: DUF2752 domain-containing protein [Bacteroidota bacterium]|nr:DUF2752 domain-containing protein [Bacteroidota bacterium]